MTNQGGEISPGFVDSRDVVKNNCGFFWANWLVCYCVIIHSTRVSELTAKILQTSQVHFPREDMHFYIILLWPLRITSIEKKDRIPDISTCSVTWNCGNFFFGKKVPILTLVPKTRGRVEGGGVQFKPVTEVFKLYSSSPGNLK